jgi:hypothetical protein
MLFSFGHGQHILIPSDGQPEAGMPATKALRSVAPGAELGDIAESGVEAGLSGTDAQSFGYMFPEGAGVPGDDASTVDAIKALAAAMVEATGDPAEADADIAPIMTYFGQFIDHDITANTDRDATINATTTTSMTGPTIEPLDRAAVVSNVMNLRNGSLRLDSLYGEGPSDTPFTIKWRNAMRDPSDRAKMRIGRITPPIPGFESIPLPADGGADLPRLGQALDDPQSGLTEADINALPDDMKAGFMKDGRIHRAMALIGDGRNDENLIVAQLHLAFLRFHNAIADGLAADIPDAETRFEEAKRRTTMIYQWLVLNVYLPRICMPSVVDGVKAAGAPLYHEFRQRVASAASEMPMPLEFSVAAFRFGHSMVRAEYDHNRNFGRPADGGNRRASFLELFSFTGGDNLGFEITGQSFEELPSNWPIEWDRFAHDTPLEADHKARRIDTKLAPPLVDMIKEDDDLSDTDAAGELGRILRNLAERNLRRSHRLNIPSGQAAVAAINAFDQSSGSSVEAGVHEVAYDGNLAVQYDPPATPPEGIAVLPEEVLTDGPAGAALTPAMVENTPLWFYILKEAEVTEGDTLGPLGSRIVAETLVGLAVEDDASFWHEGAGDGSWTPAEAPVAGQAITDFPKMLTVCGLM